MIKDEDYDDESDIISRGELRNSVNTQNSPQSANNAF